MRFTWNWIKAETHRDKHGVSFDEACSCFSDVWHVVWFDPDHSDEEDRELLIG